MEPSSSSTPNPVQNQGSQGPTQPSLSEMVRIDVEEPPRRMRLMFGDRREGQVVFLRSDGLRSRNIRAEAKKNKEEKEKEEREKQTLLERVIDDVAGASGASGASVRPSESSSSSSGASEPFPEILRRSGSSGASLTSSASSESSTSNSGASGASSTSSGPSESSTSNFEASEEPGPSSSTGISGNSGNGTGFSRASTGMMAPNRGNRIYHPPREFHGTSTMVVHKQRWSYRMACDIDAAEQNDDGQMYYIADPFLPMPRGRRTNTTAIRMNYAAQRLENRKFRGQASRQREIVGKESESASCDRCGMRYFLPSINMQERISYVLPANEDEQLPTVLFECPVCKITTRTV